MGEKRLLHPESPSENSSPDNHVNEEDLLDGLEEVNLLEGLLAGPLFGKLGREEIDLSTVRLGTASRQKLFSLPPVLLSSPAQPSPSPMTAVRKAHPTLRKSFRKTLQTVSGFRVRMRTVFVPYVLLPEKTEVSVDYNDNDDEEEKSRERREAGSEERTVVLCVEVENSGDLNMTTGFMVEKVDVTVGGDGAAKAMLIGWGEHGFTPDAAKTTFPLRIGPLAQYNLLYAVTFMRSPEEIDAFSFARSNTSNRSADLQRAVTINIYGKPYISPRSSKALDNILDSYPTQTFSSRWNCVLDLSSQQSQLTDPIDLNDASTANYPNILPEPASPFPGFSSFGAGGGQGSSTPVMFSFGSASNQNYADDTAGSRKFPLSSGGSFAGRRTNLTPSRSFRMVDSPQGGGGVLRSVSPNHVANYLRSPTTYSAPPPPPMSAAIHPPRPLSLPLDDGDNDRTPPYNNRPNFNYHLGASAIDTTPLTPAYPAYPSKSALPPTPMSQGPIGVASVSAMHGGSGSMLGPSVEIRRERGVGLGQQLGVPQTPLPMVSSGAFGGEQQRMIAKLENSAASGESIVVSVGLLPLSLVRDDNFKGQEKKMSKEVLLGPDKIFPLDIFTLDIFVFNQSLWPRRFEVTCPEKRRKRRGGAESGVYGGGSRAARKMGYPGVLPLDGRVRIGPLRPSTCQSVRMDFLAVTPGVHSIDALTLTDVETGYSTNLRSVIDIVVHDPEA